MGNCQGHGSRLENIKSFLKSSAVWKFSNRRFEKSWQIITKKTQRLTQPNGLDGRVCRLLGKRSPNFRTQQMSLTDMKEGRRGGKTACVRGIARNDPVCGSSTPHMPERCAKRLSRGIWLPLILFMLVAFIKTDSFNGLPPPQQPKSQLLQV